MFFFCCRQKTQDLSAVKKCYAKLHGRDKKVEEALTLRLHFTNWNFRDRVFRCFQRTLALLPLEHLPYKSHHISRQSLHRCWHSLEKQKTNFILCGNVVIVQFTAHVVVTLKSFWSNHWNSSATLTSTTKSTSLILMPATVPVKTVRMLLYMAANLRDAMATCLLKCS